MPVTTMSHMWQLLDTYTLTPQGTERAVNHINEWGGFSRLLGMPVFTAWEDLATYDKATKMTKALVCDTAWPERTAGLNNQERWLTFAETKTGGVAAFFIIHAADVKAELRKVKYIEEERIFVGKVLRVGGKTYVIGEPRPLAD